MSVSEAVRAVLSRDEQVRGSCPMCGEKIVSTCYWIEGKGYAIVWECVGALAKDGPTCDYRRVL